MLENILVRPIFGFFSVYYSLKNEMKADPPCSLFPMFCSLFPVFCSLFCDPCPFLLASYFRFLHPSPISLFILTNSSFSTRHSLASHSPLTRHSLTPHSPLTCHSLASHSPSRHSLTTHSPFATAPYVNFPFRSSSLTTLPYQHSILHCTVVFLPFCK